MDELDRKIVVLLQTQGRASNAYLARKVGVSEGTIRRRLKKLLQNGYINVVAVADPSKLGYLTEAVIGVQVDPDKIDSVADGLNALHEASWVAVTTGAFDLLVWVTLRSASGLGDFLKNQVGTIEGVRRTETFVTLSVRKRTYGVAL
ncbi:MAG: Lrp/AsnC family transcriptional regulator [Chloroflexi bacterium]|nr:Lrp/AsnC family transcriptional regulator [Chloroflexota bacterium]